MATDGGTQRAVTDFEAGAYKLSRPIVIDPAVTLRGDGSTLKLVAGAIGALRSVPYSGSAESLPLNIFGFDIDGESGASSGAIGVDLGATVGATGRLSVTLRNITVRNMSGAGVRLGHHLAGRIDGVRAENCHGGLEVFGHNNEMQITNFSSTTGIVLASTPGGADINFLAASGTFMVRNLKTDGNVVLSFSQDDLTFLGHGIHAPDGPLRVYAPKGLVRVAHSTFGSTSLTGPGPRAIVSPANVTFSRTTFVGTKRPDSTSANYRTLEVDLAACTESSRCALHLEDCTFKHDETIGPSDPAVALYVTGPLVAAVTPQT